MSGSATEMSTSWAEKARLSLPCWQRFHRFSSINPAATLVTTVPERLHNRPWNPTDRTAILLGLICFVSVVIRVAYRIHAGGEDFWQNGYLFFYEYARNIVAGKGLWIA